MQFIILNKIQYTIVLIAFITWYTNSLREVSKRHTTSGPVLLIFTGPDFYPSLEKLYPGSRLIHQKCSAHHVDISNYNRDSVYIFMHVCMYVYMWLCFHPRRLASRAPNFQGLIYDPTNET